MFLFAFFYIFFLLVHYREPCVFSCYSFFNKIFSYLSKKKSVADLMMFSNGVLHWEMHFCRDVHNWELEALMELH